MINLNLSKVFHISRDSLSKIMVVTLSIILIISMILLSISYRVQPETVITTKKLLAEIRVDSGSVFKVKPVIIYDYREYVETSKTYYDLVKGLNISLRFTPSITSGKVLRINETYSLKTYLSTSIYGREYPLIDVIKSTNPLRLLLIVDFKGMDKLVKTIEDEIGVRVPRYEYTITIMYKAVVTYSNGVSRTYEVSPKITIYFDRDANTIRISWFNMDKKYTSEKTTRKINYFNIGLANIPIRTFRTYTFYTTITLSIIFAISILNYISSGRRMRILTPLEKYSRLIINGEVIHESDKPVIIINDPDRLAIMSKNMGKPIIYDEKKKELVLITEDAIYKYKL